MEISKRKEYLRNYQKNWIKRRRDQWLKENGPCKTCGSTENLEVDHIIPEDKKFNARALWSRKEETRKAELLKCQVLCKECHKQKTIQWLIRNRTHGTVTMYKAGCKCLHCTKASVDYVNEWRWRTGRRKKRDLR